MAVFMYNYMKDNWAKVEPAAWSLLTLAIEPGREERGILYLHYGPVVNSNPCVRNRGGIQAVHISFDDTVREITFTVTNEYGASWVYDGVSEIVQRQLAFFIGEHLAETASSAGSGEVLWKHII